MQFRSFERHIFSSLEYLRQLKGPLVDKIRNVYLSSFVISWSSSRNSSFSLSKASLNRTSCSAFHKCFSSSNLSLSAFSSSSFWRIILLCSNLIFSSIANFSFCSKCLACFVLASRMVLAKSCPQSSQNLKSDLAKLKHLTHFIHQVFIG